MVFKRLLRHPRSLIAAGILAAAGNRRARRAVSARFALEPERQRVPHGTGDRVVPHTMSDQLYAAAVSVPPVARKTATPTRVTLIKTYMPQNFEIIPR